MIYDILKFLLACHAAEVGKRTKCKELVIESIGMHRPKSVVPARKRECDKLKHQKEQARIVAEKGAKAGRLRLGMVDSDNESLPPAAFPKSESHKLFKSKKRRLNRIDYERCIDRLPANNLDSDEERACLDQATKILSVEGTMY